MLTLGLTLWQHVYRVAAAVAGGGNILREDDTDLLREDDTQILRED